MLPYVDLDLITPLPHELSHSPVRRDGKNFRSDLDLIDSEMMIQTFMVSTADWFAWEERNREAAEES